jgi:hypothetical protein
MCAQRLNVFTKVSLIDIAAVDVIALKRLHTQPYLGRSRLGCRIDAHSTKNILANHAAASAATGTHTLTMEVMDISSPVGTYSTGLDVDPMLEAHALRLAELCFGSIDFSGTIMNHAH